MTMGELIVAVIRFSKKAQYVVEIDHRIDLDPTIPDRIDQALKGTLSKYTLEREEKPPGTESESPTAVEILNSDWDCSGLRSDPVDVRNMCRDVADEYLSEEDMTDQQRKFWRAIKSHFRQWEKSQWSSL
jgi:hypothetical protein